MCYIGQTTQSFTLRWWQHIKWGRTGSKFHIAVQESKVTDWIFQVIEVAKSKKELDRLEKNWIRHYNSAQKGYNSRDGNGEIDQNRTLESFENNGKETP